MAETAQQYIQRILGHVEGPTQSRCSEEPRRELKKAIHGPDAKAVEVEAGAGEMVDRRDRRAPG